eukprot:scaffold43267_cov63-Phaeocystis_antarctica.AAC.4
MLAARTRRAGTEAAARLGSRGDADDSSLSLRRGAVRPCRAGSGARNAAEDATNSRSGMGCGGDRPRWESVVCASDTPAAPLRGTCTWAEVSGTNARIRGSTLAHGNLGPSRL